MAINTPLSDTLDGYLNGLLAGKSAVTKWKSLDSSRIYSKVGGDLSDYDYDAKVKSFEGRIPPEVYKRLRRLVSKAAWSTKLTMLLAVDGYLNAGLFDKDIDPTRVAGILAGHNINCNYVAENRLQFNEEPDYIDGMLALNGLDTDHAGCVSELLNIKGPIYTMGAACSSGNTSLRNAIDEIRYHDNDVAVVAGAVLDFSTLEIHAMAIMGAITIHSFNETPEKASRPYDTRREGFVPSHGGGVLVVERLSHALARGARIWAEVVGVEANSDANHLPNPSEDGQTRLMTRILKKFNVEPTLIDYVNAHATSTALGDATELRSIKNVFGKHAYKLKVNATKSMLGHTCWAAPIVETVAAIMQMHAGNGGRLHPSINIDNLDPEVDLDVCRNVAVDHPVRYIMKNSFGFGGINCVSVLKRYEG